MSFDVTYSGAHRRMKKWLLLGTDHGNICGFQEVNSVVEECPTFFLRLTDYAPMEHVVKHTLVDEENTGRLNKFVAGLVQSKRTNSVLVEPQVVEAVQHKGALHHSAHHGGGQHGGGHGPHHDDHHHPPFHSHLHGHRSGHHSKELEAGKGLEEGSLAQRSLAVVGKENQSGTLLVFISSCFQLHLMFPCLAFSLQ
jgi:hypothetical protein